MLKIIICLKPNEAYVQIRDECSQHKCYERTFKTLSFLNLAFSWEKWRSHGLVRLNAADNTNGGLLMILTSVIKANVIIIGLEVHLFH